MTPDLFLSSKTLWTIPCPLHRTNHPRLCITISPGLRPTPKHAERTPTLPVRSVPPCFHECTNKQLIGWSLCVTIRCARTLTSSLFGLSFLACVLTTSASIMLPCPVHPHRGRFAVNGNNVDDHQPLNGRRAIIVEKQPRRWIEVHHPRV
jgi:cytochrome c oxidase assembly factor 2